jgi:hypothetical protein
VVFWSFAYLALRRVLRLIVLVLRGDRSKEIEIPVLGYQVRRPDSWCCIWPRTMTAGATVSGSPHYPP